MIAVRSRGTLRFMGAIFFLSPCLLREEPAVHALAGARLDSCQIPQRRHTSPYQTQQASPAWARPYHNFFQVENVPAPDSGVHTFTPPSSAEHPSGYDKARKEVLRRAESQAILLRVHEAVDHRAKVTRMRRQIVYPGIEPRGVRRAPQVAIVL